MMSTQLLETCNVLYNLIVYQVGHLPRVVSTRMHGQQNIKKQTVVFLLFAAAAE